MRLSRTTPAPWMIPLDRPERGAELRKNRRHGPGVTHVDGAVDRAHARGLVRAEARTDLAGRQDGAARLTERLGRRTFARRRVVETCSLNLGLARRIVQPRRFGDRDRRSTEEHERASRYGSPAAVRTRRSRLALRRSRPRPRRGSKRCASGNASSERSASVTRPAGPRPTSRGPACRSSSTTARAAVSSDHAAQHVQGAAPHLGPLVCCGLRQTGEPALERVPLRRSRRKTERAVAARHRGEERGLLLRPALP